MSWLLRRILALWVRFTVLPQDAVARLQAPVRPRCYVLEHRSSTDYAVLQSACARLQLPSPRKRLLPQADFSWFHLGAGDRGNRRPTPQLARLIDLLRADPGLDVELVPVAVYWGRAPQRESSWLRLMLVENWQFTTRLRRFFQVLFSGRNTLLEFGEAVSLRSLMGAADVPTVVQCRRVVRALRARYAGQRAARIGPNLSDRRTVVNDLLRTRAVRAAVAAEARDGKRTRRQLLLEARAHAYEIAANYSPAFVRFLEKLFSWLWNRIYGGVELAHAETLGTVADGNEIIYVPCHRSHIDYLLLSYVIYRSGYAIPHIAAGLNLNLPVVGRFLRMGGGFFIRRSFRQGLYTMVFTSYMAAIMARGHSVEYFIEGGRSRTGRLLAPKTGMLTMTLRGFLRAPKRPIVFVPVYFGYERIMEGATYVSELSGKPKEKESVLGLLKTVPRLKENFGRVHVNIGEPIALDGLLARHDPQWRERVAQDEGKQPWLNAAVNELAADVMRNINAAAAVTPVNLLAMALLAAPRRTLAEADLVRHLELLLALLTDCPYSPRVTVTTMTPSQIIGYGVDLKVIVRDPHTLGDLVRMPDEAALLATYQRNNVLHLFALPSLIACAFDGNARMSAADLARLTGRIYPYIASELFLVWPEQAVPAALDAMLAAMARQGLIERLDDGQWARPAPTSPQAMQLSLLAQSTLQTVERYYLAISLLLRAGSGELSQSQLEARCHQTAQRMGLLYGVDSPEFFDRALFENFIDLLRKRGVLKVSGGALCFDQVLHEVAADAQVVLSEELRHSILQITHT